jgi:hypothetical protein
MSLISHLCEPTKLLLTWQGLESATNPKARTRFVVGEITPSADRSTATLRYLRDTVDFNEALSFGFQGYPAFNVKSDETLIMDVLPAFMRRLPPRKREDFSIYLQRHLLPSPFDLSDFALLGYTGARLPSDGFAFSPVFDCTELPCQIVIDLAGTRHHASEADIAMVNIGDEVQLVLEPNNLHDPDAIYASINGKKMGYINRVIKTNVHGWMKCANVTATVCKKNGTPERPLIYILVTSMPK